jgi:hypothetical protein
VKAECELLSSAHIEVIDTLRTPPRINIGAAT